MTGGGHSRARVPQGAPGEILIATADDDVREDMQRTFERAGFQVRSARTGEEALDRLDRGPTRLAVVDLALPDMTGYEVCFEIRQSLGESVAVILVSADRTESSDRVAGLMIGADDYMAEPVDTDELLARARRLMARVGRGPGHRDAPLTARETEVLQLLANGDPPDVIAAALFISPKTVATHLQRIITKLGVHNRTEAVARAYRDGLITGAGAGPHGGLGATG